MQITEDWMESIKDKDGLTRGQATLLQIWEKKQGFVGYGYLPDQVAHVIETCKGYRGMPEHIKDRLR